jgi:ABC-type hemin transport system substrate-binding protein
MSRQKRTSRVLEKAELRASGMKSILPSIKFEQDYTLEKLIETIEKLRNKLDVHNSALAIVDSTLTEVEEMEKNLKQFSEKMLMVVAIKYGKDSAEYEMAGGVRNSDRLRKMRASRLKNIAEQASDKNAKTA